MTEKQNNGKYTIEQLKFEDIFGESIYCSIKREGSPSLVNEYECVGCGTVKNLIRTTDINEPVHCKKCLIQMENQTE